MEQKSIPRTLANITPEWLNGALGERFPGIAITTVHTSGFYGHKPNKSFIHLGYGGRRRAEHPDTVFVEGSFKVDPDAPRSGLDIGNQLELLAYREVVPLLDVNTPECFHVVFDKELCEGVAVLEDIHAAGAVSLKGRVNLNFGEAAAFIDSMSRYHAQWWDSAEFADGGRFGPASPLAMRTAFNHEHYVDRLVCSDGWDNYVKLPRGQALPIFLQYAGRMAAAQVRLKEIHNGVARTIIHGDEHLGNLYLEADGCPGILDWCTRIEAWSLAFAYFIVSVVDTMDRRNWERPLLHRYLQQLARHGVTPPGFEEAWYFYRCATLFPCLTWLNNSNDWQPEAVNTRNTVRAAASIIDHDVLRLLGV